MHPDEQTLIAGKLPGPLLQRLLDKYVRSDPRVLIGPEVGADAAAIQVDTGIIIVKSDPITFPTPDIAQYLVNVNANDVVCMGGQPRWMLVSALLPSGSTTSQSVESLFAELASACDELGIILVGGHTEITDSVRRPVLVGTLLGESSEDGLLDLRRSQPGDDLLLCNSVAIEGTAILANESDSGTLKSVPAPLLEQARNLTTNPGISVVPAARAVRESGVTVRGMHDPTEGGIATALAEVAGVAGCAIELTSEIPIREDTRVICDALGLNPLGLIASGSLLVVIKPDGSDRALKHLYQQGIDATLIGRLHEHRDGTRVIQANGTPLPSFPTDEIARYFTSLHS